MIKHNKMKQDFLKQEPVAVQESTFVTPQNYCVVQEEGKQYISERQQDRLQKLKGKFLSQPSKHTSTNPSQLSFESEKIVL